MEYIKLLEPLLKVIALLGGILWWSYYSRTKAKKLARELEIAKADIRFLLQVETEYAAEFKLLYGQSLKNQIRGRAKMAGHQWSGKYTKGRIPITPKDAEQSGIIAMIEKLLK